MKFEQPNFVKQEKGPQKLEDMLSFLKPKKEEMEFNEQAKKAADLLSAGKMNEAIQLSNLLRDKQPKDKEFNEQEIKLFEEKRKELVEQLGYKVTQDKGKWFGFENKDYWISLKHFIKPSFAGYKNGRISEISVTDKKNKEDSVEFYGGDIQGLKNIKTKKIFDEIVNYFN